MNYSITNLSVAPGVGHFLLFPALHGGAFVAFCRLLKLIPAYILGWRGVRAYFDWCITRFMWQKPVQVDICTVGSVIGVAVMLNL